MNILYCIGSNLIWFQKCLSHLPIRITQICISIFNYYDTVVQFALRYFLPNSIVHNLLRSERFY